MFERHQILSLAGVAMLAVALVTASCGGSSTPTTEPVRLADSPRDGAQLFAAACASCHGPKGDGGMSGVPLDMLSAADRQMVIRAIRDGVGGMPASSDGMSDEQIDALVDYVAGLR